MPKARMPRTRVSTNIGRLLIGPSSFMTLHITRSLNNAGFPDIRPAHGNVLSFIGHGPQRLTDLAALANVTKATVNYLVDDLEKLGYVERQPDPKDRRVKWVTLTPKGHELGKATIVALGALEAQWRQILGAERFALLKEALVDLNEALWPQGLETDD